MKFVDTGSEDEGDGEVPEYPTEEDVVRDEL